jgi:hypothetical protein
MTKRLVLLAAILFALAIPGAAHAATHAAA